MGENAREKFFASRSVLLWSVNSNVFIINLSEWERKRFDRDGKKN